MTTYATVDELQERLDWTLSEGEEGMAAAALEDLSEWAAHHGRNWSEANVPRLVVRIVLTAAARFMRNPDGFETSRAGDETVDFHKPSTEPGSAEFTEKEIAAIRRIAHPYQTGLHSLQMVAYGTTPPVDLNNYVPVGPGDGKLFPFYAEGGPW